MNTLEFIFLNLGSTVADKTGKKLLLRLTKLTDFICYKAHLFYYIVDFVDLSTFIKLLTLSASSPIPMYR